MGASGALRIFEEVGSTNDVVRELAEKGGAHGAAVAARRQTAGRGRRGHVWESPLGNLYLSILLRPDVAPSRLPGLAAACGLGALDGLQIAGVSNEVQLKWPNDLLAQERKLGGILVEVGRGSAEDVFAVCGIGINLEISPRNLGAICLEELGSARGRCGGTDLAAALEQTAAELRAAAETAARETEQKGRMDRVLGLTAGAALVILLW